MPTKEQVREMLLEYFHSKEGGEHLRKIYNDVMEKPPGGDPA